LVGVLLSHVYLTYPVVGVLALAAALPIMVPSMFFEPASAEAAPARVVRAPAVTVVSTSPPGSAAPVVVSSERRDGTTSSASDDRWWRAQVNRVMTTSSVVVHPDPQRPSAPAAQPPPAEPVPFFDLAARGNQTVHTVNFAPPERLSTRVPAQIRRWEPLILKASRKHDVDPTLIAALMMTESSGNPNAVSHAGANGLLQVLHGPMDPEGSIEEGTEMLAGLIQRFRSLDLALAAYNAGPTAVVRHGGVPPYAETQNHISRTLSSYAAWK
jgi:soluble lytic murein transglycosylase-like protein